MRRGTGGGLLFGLMCAEDHVSSNVCGVFFRQLASEGNHSVRLKQTATNDIKPQLTTERTRVAKIGQHSAADRDVAVTGGAVSLEQTFAVPDHRLTGCRGGWVQLWLFESMQWRQGSSSGKFEGED